MISLSPSKKRKLLLALRAYRKKYLVGKYSGLDESATRIMLNSFLTDVLGFASLDEIKTEYMIRGTYADYVVQIKGKQSFIVEVKAMSVELSERSLRQAVNYAANEGIEWALLTNGKCFEFYRVIFDKPIDVRKVFAFDLSDKVQLKRSVECFQYLTRQLVARKGLDHFWNKFSALDASNVAGLLYSKNVVNFLRRQLNSRFRCRFKKEEIVQTIDQIIKSSIEDVRPKRESKKRGRKRAKRKSASTAKAPALAGAQKISSPTEPVSL